MIYIIFFFTFFFVSLIMICILDLSFLKKNGDHSAIGRFEIDTSNLGFFSCFGNLIKVVHN